MNLSPRAEVPGHQSAVTSATVMLSIFPLIPDIRKRAPNDSACKHQCSHGTDKSKLASISIPVSGFILTVYRHRFCAQLGSERVLDRQGI